MHSTGRREGGKEGLREGRNFPPASYVTCVGTGLRGFDQGGCNRPKKCLTPLENENSRNMLKICLIHIQT